MFLLGRSSRSAAATVRPPTPESKTPMGRRACFACPAILALLVCAACFEDDFGDFFLICARRDDDGLIGFFPRVSACDTLPDGWRGNPRSAGDEVQLRRAADCGAVIVDCVCDADGHLLAIGGGGDLATVVGIAEEATLDKH